MVYNIGAPEKEEAKLGKLSDMNYILHLAAYCNRGLLFYTSGKKDSETLELLKNGKEFCKRLLRGAYIVKDENGGVPIAEALEPEDYKFARAMPALLAKWQFYDLIEKAKEIGTGLDGILEGKDIQKDKLSNIEAFFITVNTILGQSCSRLSEELEEIKYPFLWH